jgi:hypothetical protein
MEVRDMRLFSDGTIYFIDGRTENIKYALASDNVVVVMAGSGTYLDYVECRE